MTELERPGIGKTNLVVAALLLTPLLFHACASNAAPDLSPVQLAEAHAAFDRVYEVLQHPRCLNCHPAGDRPLQYDAGLAHGMNVVRGPDDRGVAGMRCDSCHGTTNALLPHMPPGVSSGWRLAPREMVFEDATKAQLATQLLDPRLVHMNTEEMLEHVAQDPLVLWGWNPGPNRTPVPLPHADFVAAFRTWIEAGAPVPPEGTR